MLKIKTYTFSIVKTCNGITSTIPCDSIVNTGEILLNPLYVKRVTRLECKSLFSIEVDSDFTKNIYTDYEGYLKLSNDELK